MGLTAMPAVSSLQTAVQMHGLAARRSAGAFRALGEALETIVEDTRARRTARVRPYVCAVLLVLVQAVLWAPVVGILGDLL